MGIVSILSAVSTVNWPLQCQKESEIKSKIGETNQQLTALLDREPKKDTESPAYS